MKSFRATLADVMDTMRLKQTDVARAAGVSDSQVSRYLTGASSPTWESLTKLMTALPKGEAEQLAVAFLGESLPRSYRESFRFELGSDDLLESGVLSEPEPYYSTPHPDEIELEQVMRESSPETRRALIVLAKLAMSDREMADLIESMAKIMRPKL